MQTILGAGGQIANELAVFINRNYTDEVRLVSRSPRKVNETDQPFQANLLDPEQTRQAVEGSDIVCLTVGLPMDTDLWVRRWPIFMRNTIEACVKHDCKLVFFDNTYMYPQTDEPQTEETRFAPNGKKGRVRAEIVRELLDVIEQGKLQALICRAPEFYGPGQTQSITNSTVIEPLSAGKAAKVFLRDDTLRTLIYTPDASKGMALLGNTPDAYGQTWHLPCDDERLTYRQFVELAAEVFGTAPRYRVLKRWQLKLAGLFVQRIRDAAELLPRYEVDNIFSSDKFKRRFPEFPVTTYRQGLTTI